MVKEKIKDDKIYYICENCGFAYKDRKTAQKYQGWCDEHKSCNMKITKNSLKLGKKGCC